MFRKSDPVVEIKPIPKKSADGDDALAYFGLNAPEAPTRAPGGGADDGRIRALEANVAALRAESAALPGKLKKMALFASSYSPNVYNGAIGEYRGIINYWGVEDTGIVTAKIDEQKTDATRNRILEIVGKL